MEGRGGFCIKSRRNKNDCQDGALPLGDTLHGGRDPNVPGPRGPGPRHRSQIPWTCPRGWQGHWVPAEKIPGARNAEPADLESCKAALGRFHALGFVHGDCNKYNFLVTRPGG